METIRLIAQVDAQHQLLAEVPASVPPGPVTVILIPSHQEEDDAGIWMAGIAREWAAELNDPREDIYTLADGESTGAV